MKTVRFNYGNITCYTILHNYSDVCGILSAAEDITINEVVPNVHRYLLYKNEIHFTASMVNPSESCLKR